MQQLKKHQYFGTNKSLPICIYKHDINMRRWMEITFPNNRKWRA